MVKTTVANDTQYQLTDFPKEVLTIIFKFCDNESLKAISFTCKEFRALVVNIMFIDILKTSKALTGNPFLIPIVLQSLAALLNQYKPYLTDQNQQALTQEANRLLAIMDENPNQKTPYSCIYNSTIVRHQYTQKNSRSVLQTVKLSVAQFWEQRKAKEDLIKEKNELSALRNFWKKNSQLTDSTLPTSHCSPVHRAT